MIQKFLGQIKKKKNLIIEEHEGQKFGILTIQSEQLLNKLHTPRNVLSGQSNREGGMSYKQ